MRDPVSSLRTRMRGSTDADADADRSQQQRRRARTSGAEMVPTSGTLPEAGTIIPGALAEAGTIPGSDSRPWANGPRRLRGLHPAPVIVYVRENPRALACAMDSLYDALVGTFHIDARDIRVSDVPTCYDLPAAVRRLGRDKQLVIAVGLLARSSPWFDHAQVERVRDYLLQWAQAARVPLVDGLLVDASQEDLDARAASPHWCVAARHLDPDSPAEPPPACQFGHYLAHRAIEMFYVEHRGW
ncbi:hypothetical protein GGF46_003428 [Coemansia sp. RSA 552]|nr:hypothetical protein GGF46_003428 [Coemansia sp. RSA 552]